MVDITLFVAIVGLIIALLVTPFGFKPVPLIVVLIHDLREWIKEKIKARERK